MDGLVPLPQRLMLGVTPFGIPEGEPLPPERLEPSSVPVRGASLEDVYRSQAPRLMRLFRRRADRDDAQDLLQDTFVRFARIEPEARAAIESIPAYLTRVAGNLLRDRGKAFRRSGPLQPLDEERDMVATSDPLTVLESRDILNRVEAAMLQLTPTTREIFMARRLDGLSHAEIAERTGLAVKTIEWHMTKALTQLHRVLKTR